MSTISTPYAVYYKVRLPHRHNHFFTWAGISAGNFVSACDCGMELSMRRIEELINDQFGGDAE